MNKLFLCLLLVCSVGQVAATGALTKVGLGAVFVSSLVPAVAAGPVGALGGAVIAAMDAWPLALAGLAAGAPLAAAAGLLLSAAGIGATIGAIMPGP
jgi:hypothetical protein